jgi:hypothetical protein
MVGMGTFPAAVARHGVRRNSTPCGMGERAAGLACKLLQRRIGLIPARLTGQIQDLPLERIEALGEALLDFTNLADLETWLRQH